MDSETLVKGGAEGLLHIAAAFAEHGIPVEGIYLIKSTTEDGSVFWRLRLVTDTPQFQVIQALVRLEREGKLPLIDPDVLVGPIRAGSPEASRIIDYARHAPGRPVEIRNTPVDGLFVEYALVADWPASGRAAA